MDLKPKYLILARHGSYEEETGELDENGRKTVERLAQKLKANYLQEIQPMIVSSPKLRTKQTAEIYAKILNVPISKIQEEYLLRGIKDDPTKAEEIRIEEVTKTIENLVNSKKAKAYLLITHEDTAIDSIILFRKRNFEIEQNIETMGFGCAFLIDLEDPRPFIRLRP